MKDDKKGSRSHIPGMTLRDYFAGQALAGLSTRHGGGEVLAQASYQIADAMLKERER